MYTAFNFNLQAYSYSLHRAEHLFFGWLDLLQKSKMGDNKILTADGHSKLATLRRRLDRTVVKSRIQNEISAESQQVTDDLDTGVNKRVLPNHPPDFRAWTAMARLYAGRYGGYCRHGNLTKSSFNLAYLLSAATAISNFVLFIYVRT